MSERTKGTSLIGSPFYFKESLSCGQDIQKTLASDSTFKNLLPYIECKLVRTMALIRPGDAVIKFFREGHCNLAS
jgi:hypothetical protein